MKMECPSRLSVLRNDWMGGHLRGQMLVNYRGNCNMCVHMIRTYVAKPSGDHTILNVWL